MRPTQQHGGLPQRLWTMDRYLLMKSGEPQRYGTQLVFRDGRSVLHEVDPAVTDEERARWNVPPLAQARATAMNKPRSEASRPASW